MVDRVEVRGLRLTVVCGVLPEERARPQPLEVDLDLELDLGPAGESDDLTHTVDYSSACDIAATVAGAGQPLLLERMAHEIARSLLEADHRVRSVEVALRKLHPPVAHDVASTGVRIRRVREEA